MSPVEGQPEMGLTHLAKEEHITHASSLTKLVWLIKNVTNAHKLTFTVATISFGIIMIGRYGSISADFPQTLQFCEVAA